MDIKKLVTEFVRRNVDQTFDPDADRLIDFLDSVSLLMLVQEIDAAGISMQLAELSMDRLESVATFATWVEEQS